MDKILELVDKQAQDEGLWFDAMTASEAYLQAALRELHRVIEVDNWISVEERLPDVIGSYLVYHDPEISWAFYNSDGQWCQSIGYFIGEQITHWHPIPRPPETRQ